MVDNVTANPGAGGAILRTDDVGGGVHIPYTKLNAGGDGVDLPIVAGQQTMDNSLPVAVASNQPQVNTPLEATGTLGALNAAVTLDLMNMPGASVHILAGTFVGTLTFECSLDNANWKTTAFNDVATPVLSGNPNITITNANLPFLGTPFFSGYRYVRVRVSAYTSGSTTAFFCAKPSITTQTFQSVAVSTDNGAFTDNSSRVIPGGYYFDETAGTALTENDIGAARMDSKRAIVVGIEDATTRGRRTAVDASGNLAVGPKASATGGATIGKVLSAASTNATNLKASAGKVIDIVLMNTNAAVRYLHLYNKASAPTVGTDVPVATIAIPGNAAGAGFAAVSNIGLDFATGISYSLTTGAADNDANAVALNEITGWITYK